jgi:hypothetical protein
MCRRSQLCQVESVRCCHRTSSLTRMYQGHELKSCLVELEFSLVSFMMCISAPASVLAFRVVPQWRSSVDRVARPFHYQRSCMLSNILGCQ